MKLEIFLQSPAGQTVPWPGGRAKVRQLSWALYGGPEQAEIALDPEISYDEATAFSGWKVFIRNRLHTLVWWGFVEGIEACSGMEVKLLSLRNLANRVAVSYLSQDPDASYGLRAQTPWVEDLASKASYGIKEKLLQLGRMGEEEARLHADRYLAAHAFLKQEMRPATGKREPGLVLRCAGWFETLAWRHFSPQSSLAGNLAPQSGSLSFGMADTNLKLAQGFKPKAEMQARFVALRLRKIGLPSDLLSVQIQTDQGGAPSGAAVASSSLPAQELSESAYTWRRLNLTGSIRLNADQPYWLVISRTGGVSADSGFSLAADQGLNCLSGSCLGYNQAAAAWQELSPQMDLLFQVGGLRSTETLINELFAACGQHLSGISVKMLASPQISCLDTQLEDGRTALCRLLDLGDGLMNPLIATVDPQGILRIDPLESENTAYHRNREGRLMTNRGFVIEEGLSPVGNYIREGNAKSLISHASLEVSSGLYRLQT